jgi:hypothetical protein
MSQTLRNPYGRGFDVIYFRLELEQRRYEASEAERRYQAVDPDNRLVARGLEAQWEQRLRELNDAGAGMERRQRQRPRHMNDAERQSPFALGGDLQRVWAAPTTTDRDRKELLLSPRRDAPQSHSATLVRHANVAADEGSPMHDRALRQTSVVAATAIWLLGAQMLAHAEDQIDLMLKHSTIPADMINKHGYSDFTDPLGRFLDLLAAGAFAEARSIQPEACAAWLATRQHSSLTGKFWVWNTEIDLDTLCIHG